jgi:hypothetical protein
VRQYDGNNGNNQPNDGAAWRLGATMVNGNGQWQQQCNNQPKDGAAWRLGAPWSMATAKAHGRKFKETKMHGFRKYRKLIL